MPDTDAQIELERLAEQVRELRRALLAAEAARADEIAAAHPDHRRSATNLVHYVELRRHDVRDLQRRLDALGLSALGRAEPHVVATVDTVLAVLERLLGGEPPAGSSATTVDEGLALLERGTERLLGPPPEGRDSRIMVTLPSEAAHEARLVARMLDAGMDVARVNCAHDDATAWGRMIDNVRLRQPEGAGRCRIAMDLGGPKLRTGPLAPGPRVVRVKPQRDPRGRVDSPGRAWLTAGGPVPAFADDRVVPVAVEDRAWLGRRRPGDRIDVRDARGSKRCLQVLDVSPDGCLVITPKTTYLETGLELDCDGDRAVVGPLPEREHVHHVDRGDTIVLTRDLTPAEPTRSPSAHTIGCTLPEVFDQARPGERIFFDDGKIGGVIESVTPDRLTVTVTGVKAGGAKLKAGKGINLPDSTLHLDALTDKDVVDLDFVAAHADVVNLSFVRNPVDVRRLQDELGRRGADHVGIVLKVENAAAFEHLPELLLTALRSQSVGVMIARGDLAIEVGFERLAEVQEEILWACEAAHVPVVWATQVLDTLAKTGTATRAEVTDAAMAERAECVMLNKGPHIVEAIDALHSILGRMHSHQHKKRSLLRRLRAWDGEQPSAPAATSAGT